ncbi:hypothetical protein CK203_063048 [Vitis vinifera]|uniref:Uncharacterized protein n=1 Tax=Vitis vinifera TaxID=29760 RepID=A0A438G5M7_VITVI|nr:hypothetical protein CK203_063048 [Vitis vinifera]
MVRVLMGCSILSMLFNLDLSLLEGAVRGHVLVKGYGRVCRCVRTGKDRRGKLVEWVEKASFDRLNRLFEIAAGEMSCEILLFAQNLRLVTQEPQSYILNILQGGCPKRWWLGSIHSQKSPILHGGAKGRRPGTQSTSQRMGGKKVRGTLRKAPGDKRFAPFPPVGAPAKKEEEGSHKGKRSGPSMPATERMALLAKEATSVYQSDSSLPDADVTGASCAETLPPMAPTMEDTGVERQGLPPCESSSLALVPVKGPDTRRSRPARDLKSGLSGRLQGRLLETIEVNYSSTQENHPEGSETKMAEDNPTDPILVPDEGSPEEIQPVVNDGDPKPGEESHPSASSGESPVNDAACTSSSPFSYAKLGEMLKRIPSGSDVAVPSAKMFEAAEMLVSGIRRMVKQHDLFIDLLRISDHMKAFVSQRMSGERGIALEIGAGRSHEALRIELVEAKSREEAIDARLHEAESETALLRGEVRQLRNRAQREELEADYQKQVDEMYFFGYRCCMKKHGIKRDVPSIPPGEEEKLHRKPSQ